MSRRHICLNRQQTQVGFYDDLRFNLRFNDRRIRVYRRPGERFSDATFTEHDRYGGDSVMVWAGVLQCIGSTSSTETSLLSAMRTRFWRPSLCHFLCKCCWIQCFKMTTLDHTGRVFHDCVRHLIGRLDCPVNSPDCNPIEHVWNELGGSRVYRVNLIHTLNQLTIWLLQEWANLPLDVIARCVQSMRIRCQACAANKSQITNNCKFFLAKYS